MNINTTVHIGTKTLPYPVLVASGTFGYGEEYKELCNYHKLGAIVCKTVTKEARLGNPPPRVQETEMGSLNSIGLANEGMHYFAKYILPKVETYPCPYIVNIAGRSCGEFVEIIQYLENIETSHLIWGWELNLSCPNVSGGTNFGKDPRYIHEIVSAVRPHTKLPILVKIPPNVSDVGILGRAAEEGGADGISAFNTFLGMWINTQSSKPVLSRHTGGYSGTAIFPAALGLVYELATSVSIPIIAIGGITHGNHAIQYLLAGASAVQVGTANFRDPQTANHCLQEIIHYCKEKRLQSVRSLRLEV